MSCSVISNPLCKKCIPIGRNMLSVFANIYASIIPGAPYGIIYNTSYIVVMFPIMCAPPNINPDIIMNVFLFFIMFFIEFLNTISSTNGANTTAEKNIYTGALLNVVLIVSSFAAIEPVSLFIIKLLIIIIINASI